MKPRSANPGAGPTLLAYAAPYGPTPYGVRVRMIAYCRVVSRVARRVNDGHQMRPVPHRDAILRLDIAAFGGRRVLRADGRRDGDVEHAAQQKGANDHRPALVHPPACGQAGMSLPRS
jgi:hypothetical protein